MTITGSNPIEPHVPDDPTPAQIMALLEWMDFGVYYSQQAPPTLVPDRLGGQEFELVAITGLHWRKSRDPDTATLYIEGKPYALPIFWRIHCSTLAKFLGVA